MAAAAAMRHATDCVMPTACCGWLVWLRALMLLATGRCWLMTDTDHDCRWLLGLMLLLLLANGGWLDAAGYWLMVRLVLLRRLQLLQPQLLGKFRKWK